MYSVHYNISFLLLIIRLLFTGEGSKALGNCFFLQKLLPCRDIEQDRCQKKKTPCEWIHPSEQNQYHFFFNFIIHIIVNIVVCTVDVASGGNICAESGYLVQPEPNLCLLLTDKNSYTTHTGIRTIESDIEIEPRGQFMAVS